MYSLDSIVQFSTVVILFLTLLAIIWYSFETHWLREATITATEMVHRPLVILSYKKEDQNLYISNVGNGNALEIYCRYDGEGKKDVLDPFNGYLDLLRAHDSLLFKGNVFDKAQPALAEIFEASVTPLAGKEKATLIITYKNMLHIKYQTNLFFDGKSITVLSTKRLG